MSSDRFAKLGHAVTLAIGGLVMLGVWFGSEAMTVVPGSPAVVERWIVSSASLFLSGALFGAAVTAAVLRRNRAA